MKLASLLYVACLFMVACTTSKTTVSNGVDLAKYEYASVINNDTYHIPAELMEYEILLYDAVGNSRLELIGDWRIYELTPQQQAKLLLVKYGVSRTESGESIVTVNFIDYMTGRPVASCRGAFALSFDPERNLRGAIKEVAKQISDTFPQR